MEAIIVDQALPSGIKSGAYVYGSFLRRTRPCSSNVNSERGLVRSAPLKFFM